jgi:tRNA A37 threonylcarbamoyladenosine dehydratase
MTAGAAPRGLAQAPFVLSAAEVRGCLSFQPDGGVQFRPQPGRGLGRERIALAPDHVHDVLTPTMFGLLEDLTPGSPLMAEFLLEWERVQRLLEDPGAFAPEDCGEWAYFPADGRLVRFALRRWHRLAMTVRNATLLAPAGRPHDWQAGRAALDAAVLAVAGCSVGSSVLHSSVLLLRPGHVKVADSKAYQLNNANRVRLTYRELGRNKAQVCAEQLLAIDPFLGVSVFDTGIDASNVDRFVTRGGGDEPATTLVVEETDDPPTKLLLREAARRARLPLVMVTDLAQTATVDVRRFDVSPELSLVPGHADAELRELVRAFDEDPTRERMIDAACAFSGREEVFSVPAFADILERRVDVPFAGIPQLGSTAAVAGGLAAGLIARILLHEPVPERVLVDPVRGRFVTKGALR